MDPKANLEEQRKLAAEILATVDNEAPIDHLGTIALAEKGERLAELVQALDDWRKRGGFDPYQATDGPRYGWNNVDAG